MCTNSEAVPRGLRSGEGIAERPDVVDDAADRGAEALAPAAMVALAPPSEGSDQEGAEAAAEWLLSELEKGQRLVGELASSVGELTSDRNAGVARAGRPSRDRNECAADVPRDDGGGLARELQESLLQQIYGMSLMSRGYLAAAGAGNAVDVAVFCQRVSSVCNQALRELILLAAQDRLRTAASQTLAEALETRLSLVEERAGLSASLEVGGELFLDRDDEMAIYHIAEHLLDASLRRGDTCSISVRVVADSQGVTLSVQDDAVVNGSRSHLIDVPAEVMARVADCGGRIRARSVSGNGTKVELTLRGTGVGRRSVRQSELSA